MFQYITMMSSAQSNANLFLIDKNLYIFLYLFPQVLWSTTSPCIARIFVSDVNHYIDCEWNIDFQLSVSLLLKLNLDWLYRGIHAMWAGLVTLRWAPHRMSVPSFLLCIIINIFALICHCLYNFYAYQLNMNSSSGGRRCCFWSGNSIDEHMKSGNRMEFDKGSTEEMVAHTCCCIVRKVGSWW